MHSTAMVRWSVVLLILVSGCAREQSSSVEQSRIFTTYGVNYDDTDRMMEAYAIFNFGGPTGTYLNLDGKSQVTFDGEALRETVTAINQAIYSVKKRNADVWRIHEFSYQNNGGQLFNNRIGIPNLLVTDSFPTSASIFSTLSVTWHSTDNIGPDAVFLHLARTDGSKASSLGGEITSEKSGTITVGSDRLQFLGVGQYSAQVCREHRASPTAPDAGGSLMSKSCTATTTLILQN